MGTATLPDLDVSPDDFDTAEAETFVATKTDRDDAGNLRSAYPDSSIVSRFTAGWGNRVDDAIRAIQRRLRGEVPIGVVDTPATDPGALLAWNVGDARVRLRDAANTAYAALHAATLTLANGRQVIDHDGPVDGEVAAPAGSIAMRSDEATLWINTDGSDGWSQLGGGGIYRESFGADTGTTTDARYMPFGPHVTDLAVASFSPRAYHLWRAPIAGTITAVHLHHEAPAVTINVGFYETDGTTIRGVLRTGTTSSYTLGTGVGYATSVEPGVTVAVGDRLCLQLDPQNTMGEVLGWLEVTPS